MLPKRNHYAMAHSAFRRRGLRRMIVASLGLYLAAGPTSIALADSTGHARPMGGRCETTFVFTGPQTARIEGDCHLHYLGATKSVANQTVVQQPDGTLFITNELVYTAANGDTLNANTVGVAVFTATGVTFSGTETYRNGTGRFANAIGVSAFEGSAQFASPTEGIGEYRTLGFISF